MPTTYAHYKFGEEVIARLDARSRAPLREQGSCLILASTARTFFLL